MSEWCLVRLELAIRVEFPVGSPLRSYLICLPLDADGVIDEVARMAEPARATVRRFWPNEADQSGHVCKASHGWEFSYAVGADENGNLTGLEDQPIGVGGCITLTESDGTLCAFRVVAIDPA